MPTGQISTGKLTIHTENIFPIIKKWLYSEHDIFLRELISNAVDAMNKRKAIEPDLGEMKVVIRVNKKKKTLEVSDNGIGMSASEIKKYINQIAFSGAEDFINKYKDKQASIIGHFGLGFYSTFMVAEKVSIDSLSQRKGSKAAYWECEGETEYKMEAGTHTEIGTTVTVFLNDDSKQYLESAKIIELIEKYSNFVPYPIEFEKKVINQQEALWHRKPKDVKEEDYKEFYKKLFHEYSDPLFWIHLNVDFPFNLKGILYFPPIRNQIDISQGKVKLYCNNVFVADDLKQVIPEFLLLLKGGIDIPDIPLNVSRSFLQNDEQVQKITQYITKKIADSLKEIFKSDRKKYETLWEDIHHFIKYGILTDDKFSAAVKDLAVFKTTQGDYVTVEEYQKRNKTKDKPAKIFYAASENLQVSYLNLMKEQGIEVIFSNSIIDSHLFQHLEMKNPDINFVRIDSEINENLIESDRKEIVDAANRTVSEKVKEIFDKTLNDNIEASFNKEDYADYIKKYPDAINTLAPYIRTREDFTHVKPYDIPAAIREKLGSSAFQALLDRAVMTITTQVKYLKAKNIPAMVVFNEFMRRFQEMNYIYQQKDFDMLKNHTLIVNPENEIIQKILNKYEDNKLEEAQLMVKFVHELALLEQKSFNGSELHSFIDKANKILTMIT
ncbi:MAG: molecular chaperone HtpG [Candidatus Cloacimonetes bacterium]|nr:molecular chaperone HtpG [Candidatus Cloacimonadota bacterium]